ncbi:MAG TPA: bifunctional DNA-binding transcriptional regulator/O6-methylguanine-DNA methyltransferase Ada [Terriglobales bacterium]|nr:bifunctional DNA-binding transcriptional regulator/O6-methylguanine-DNA methyltransferase Ada [Terriglobales bacterium]
MSTANTIAFPADSLWRAVMERDHNFDRRFVYAVHSTGVFCRPSCPSRRPRREQVSFYNDAPSAAGAGYRPCLRCHPAAAEPQAEAQLRRVCDYIDAHIDSPFRLADAARAARLSSAQAQRAFMRLLGITPRAFADARRVALLKRRLRNGSDVTSAVYDAGYGSSSRVYERASSHFGMTPATYRAGGRGEQISFAIADCALGKLLVAATARGVCAVRLGDSEAELAGGLKEEFPAATLDAGNRRLRAWVQQVLVTLDGEAPAAELPLDLRGTAFQWKVWNALRQIPAGETRTYADIARSIGSPGAVRAVGSACGANPVALVVPCHRAVRSDGGLGGYRWGLERKRKLLAGEHARRSNPPAEKARRAAR